MSHLQVGLLKNTSHKPPFTIRYNLQVDLLINTSHNPPVTIKYNLKVDLLKNTSHNPPVTIRYNLQVGLLKDRLCGLVVRVSGYRYRGLGFDSRRYQIF